MEMIDNETYLRVDGVSRNSYGDVGLNRVLEAVAITPPEHHGV